MKPWLLARAKCHCWDETLAPSEFTMRLSNANAAASQDFAISMARSTGSSQG